MTTDATPHLFWITSRAAGTVALLLASAAVCLGVSMGSRLLKSSSGPDLRIVHETLSLAAMVAIAIHGLALIEDSYLHPSLLDVTVPFVSTYRTGWTTVGVISGWAVVALGLSYYARARIGQERWRRLHRLTAVGWLGGLVHSLGEGTDAGQAWFLIMVGIVVVPALVLLVWRIGQLIQLGKVSRYAGTAEMSGTSV
jgi:sulfoxide reductase heme-binding subunit YedZ